MGSSTSKSGTSKLNKNSAGNYCKQHKDCLGDRCVRKGKNGSIKEYCVSKRIDGIYFWKDRFDEKKCNKIFSCKLYK